MILNSTRTTKSILADFSFTLHTAYKKKNVKIINMKQYYIPIRHNITFLIPVRIVDGLGAW